jgi:hypothetical protein
MGAKHPPHAGGQGGAMTNARTKTSNWLYRITLGLLVLGTVRYVQFVYHQMLPAINLSDGEAFWTVAPSVYGGTATLALAAIAMFMRSGAVVWLLGLQFGQIVLLMAPSFVFTKAIVPGLIGLIVVLAIVGVGIVLFTYLMRRDEIRLP